MIILDLHLEIFIVLYAFIGLTTLIIYNVKKKHIASIYGILIFEMYVLGTIKVVFMPIRILYNSDIDSVFQIQNAIQIIPFKTIIELISINNITIQVIGNIILLMPLVLYLYYTFSINSYKKCLIYGIIASIFIELMQLIINIITQYNNKVCDIDDVLLNVLGVVLSIIIIQITRNTRLEKWIIGFLKIS